MMKTTYETLKKIAFQIPHRDNAASVLVALDRYGERFGLDQPHRLAQYIPQLLHESGEFRYDREIWGPTRAQERYDIRTDLGNTPERDGDGKKYMGRTAMQITGRDNTRSFRDWCRKYVDGTCPDFVQSPDLMNTDPWEGIGPIWYWERHGLNRFADRGDVETISRRINGGTNGLAERFTYYDRTCLVLLGFDPDDVIGFQVQAQKNGTYQGALDGFSGPRTRAALHKGLVAMSPRQSLSPDVQAAPVAVSKPVVPPAIDKPATRTTGFWERIGQVILGSGVIGAGSFGADWRVYAVIGGAVLVVALVGLFFHQRIISAVRALKVATA